MPKTIVEWFNPASDLHLAAFQFHNLNGNWPEGFLPSDLGFSKNWPEMILAKIGKYHIQHSQVSGHSAMKAVLKQYTCKLEGCGTICDSNEFFCDTHAVCPACGSFLGSDMLKGLVCNRCQREFEDGVDYTQRVHAYWEAIQQQEETEIETVVEAALGRQNLTSWLNLQDDDHHQLFLEFLGTGQLPPNVYDDSTEAWIAERVKDLSEIEGTFFVTGRGDKRG